MRPRDTWFLIGLLWTVGSAGFSPVTAQQASCWLRNATPEQAAQRPSPLGETHIVLGGEHALLCYGRPKMNDRQIMGALVPFGQPWRLGANEATALHLPFRAAVGGVELEAGSYSIYAIPGEREWEFVLNRNYQRWGIPINDAVRADDVGSFRRPVETLPDPVEQLTFRWEPRGNGAGDLILEWERTRIRIPVERKN